MFTTPPAPLLVPTMPPAGSTSTLRARSVIVPLPTLRRLERSTTRARLPKSRTDPSTTVTSVVTTHGSAAGGQTSSVVVGGNVVVVLVLVLVVVEAEAVAETSPGNDPRSEAMKTTTIRGCMGTVSLFRPTPGRSACGARL